MRGHNHLFPATSESDSEAGFAHPAGQSCLSPYFSRNFYACKEMRIPDRDISNLSEKGLFCGIKFFH